MSEKTAHNLAKLSVIGLVIQLSVIVYVCYSNYQGRVTTVENQRGGCSRSKQDRSANASGWRIAEEARRADGQLEVAKKYAKIARGLERRARINCAAAFPKARLFEW